MKKLIIACAAAALLTGTAVYADELPYLRTLPQYQYINTTLMTPESYPEVRIFPGYIHSMLSDYSDMQPIFLCFPAPQGAAAESFATQEAGFIDEANSIQYFYQVVESASFEEFINEAEDDSYILKDGSDGAAIRIDPAKRSAYGLLKTTEFGKSSKLYIKMVLDALSDKMPQETLVSELTNAIVPEVERISGAMHYEEYAPYWSTGKYAGLKMLDYDFKYLLKMDFPTFTVNYSDGGSAEQTITPTVLDGTRFEGVIDFGSGAYVDVELEFDDYSYAAHKMEENDPEATYQTLESGNEWILYISNRHSNDNTIFSWYASRPTGIQDNYGGEIYVTVNCSGNNISWADEADVLSDLAKFDSIQIIDPAEDPYVPSETPAAPESTEAAQTEAAASSETWACEACGTENTGNFCSNCGAAKPQAGPWTCPECGQENEGNFCSNCGAAKP